MGDELVTQGADLAVQDLTLEVKVGIAEDGHGGGFEYVSISLVEAAQGCVQS